MLARRGPGVTPHSIAISTDTNAEKRQEKHLAQHGLVGFVLQNKVNMSSASRLEDVRH
jgi:hypothetical protein